MKAEGILLSLPPRVGISRLLLSRGSTLTFSSKSCTEVVLVVAGMTDRAMFWTLCSLSLSMQPFPMW